VKRGEELATMRMRELNTDRARHHGKYDDETNRDGDLQRATALNAQHGKDLVRS
jgi:hypothetical protein